MCWTDKETKPKILLWKQFEAEFTSLKLNERFPHHLDMKPTGFLRRKVFKEKHLLQEWVAAATEVSVYAERRILHAEGIQA